MNKHVGAKEFVGTAVALVAVPAPENATAVYAKLAEIEQAAYGLWRSILTYRDTPAYPDCVDYRESRMTQVLADISDMHKALADV